VEIKEIVSLIIFGVITIWGPPLSNLIRLNNHAKHIKRLEEKAGIRDYDPML
jgi:hypothetical protein